MLEHLRNINSSERTSYGSVENQKFIYSHPFKVADSGRERNRDNKCKITAASSF